jgi:hypothetical protein
LAKLHIKGTYFRMKQDFIMQIVVLCVLLIKKKNNNNNNNNNSKFNLKTEVSFNNHLMEDYSYLFINLSFGKFCHTH